MKRLLWFGLLLFVPFAALPQNTLVDKPAEAIGIVLNAAASFFGDTQEVRCDDDSSLALSPVVQFKRFCAANATVGGQPGTAVFNYASGQQLFAFPGVDPAGVAQHGGNLVIEATKSVGEEIITADASQQKITKTTDLGNVRPLALIPMLPADSRLNGNSNIVLALVAGNLNGIQGRVVDGTHALFSPSGTVPVTLNAGSSVFDLSAALDPLSGSNVGVIYTVVDANQSNVQVWDQKFRLTLQGTNQAPVFQSIAPAVRASPNNSLLRIPLQVAFGTTGIEAFLFEDVDPTTFAFSLKVTAQSIDGTSATGTVTTVAPFHAVERGHISCFGAVLCIAVVEDRDISNNNLTIPEAVIIDLRDVAHPGPVIDIGLANVASRASEAASPRFTHHSWQAVATAPASGPPTLPPTLESSYAGFAFVGSAMDTTTNVANVYRQPFIIRSTCVPDDTTLCLQGGRFAVNVSDLTGAGQAGLGHAVKLTDDTGYFWFFNSANVEAIVKVLNACALNNNFWVFDAGLTNVRTLVSVTDTQTGYSRTYGNPQNTPFVPTQDSAAFSCTPPPFASTVAAEPKAEMDRSPQRPPSSFDWAPPTAGPMAGTGCVPNATTLCLSDSRFAVTTTFRTATGLTGSGMAVALTADTGFFWFFSSSNVEEVVKVLNGCPLDNNYWFFAGGLTNVQVTTTVTDTHTGHFKTYLNHQNTVFQPIQDTKALAVCP